MLRRALLLICLTACAAPKAKPAEAPAPPPPEPPVAAAEVTVPEGHIPRHQLESVLHQGPAWIFAQVPLEDVLKKGKFVGWRLRELPAEWQESGIQSGDVITQINAMPLETPSQFWAAWTSLSVASELKIAYLRDGQPATHTFPIDGSPNDAPPSASSKPPPRPSASPAEPHRRRVITIKSPQRPLSDTSVDWSP